jgi:hypothetical protein
MQRLAVKRCPAHACGERSGDHKLWLPGAQGRKRTVLELRPIALAFQEA